MILPAPQPQPARRPWLQRLLLASAAGFVATVIALGASWLEYRHRFRHGDPQSVSQAAVDRVYDASHDYRAKHRRWPGTFEELVAEQPELPRRDAWRHPLRYELRDDRPVVTSPGRDGQPGGGGYDHDLLGGERAPAEAAATFLDFLLDQPSEGMTGTCLLAGAVVFVLAVYLTARTRPMPTIVTGLLVCSIFAIIAAVVMSALHIPQPYIETGH